MEAELLKTLAQVAGIGGIALGVFLLLFRDVIRKRIFPQLTRQQAYRILVLALVLTWSVAIAGIVAWIVVPSGRGAGPSGGALAVTANLWSVDFDAKGRLVASTEVNAPGPDVGREQLEQIVHWLEGEIGLSDRPELPPVRVSMQIPADPARERPTVERSPEGRMDVMAWLVAGQKLRVRLADAPLEDWRDDFHVEIRIPGYKTVTRKVTWGEEHREEIQLEPELVKIGVETFDGEGVGIADRLQGLLARHRGMEVVSPERLEALREELRRHQETIAVTPGAQVALRKLGVDFIVGGSVRRTGGD